MANIVIKTVICSGDMCPCVCGPTPPEDPLDINNPTYPAMTVGVAITPFYAIGFFGEPPYTFSVVLGSLPTGLTLTASTGEISGTPSSAGNGSTVFRVTDTVFDTADSDSRPWAVSGVLTINNPTYPSMEVGISITPFSVTATGGLTPYTFSVIAGSLPAGLSLSSAGLVSGTPTTASSSTTTFRVTDSALDTDDSSAIGWTVAAAVSIADPNYPAMSKDVAITPFNLVASNGITPYNYSVFAGSLPAGLTLNGSTGQVSGTPTTVGSGSTTFRVTDNLGATANTSSRPWTVTTPLSINDPNYPLMQEGFPITPFSAVASGGTTPYTYSVSAGSLPAGLTLNSSSGQVSGTPTTPGSGNTTFRVTDNVSDTADSSSRPWTVNPGA